MKSACSKSSKKASRSGKSRGLEPNRRVGPPACGKLGNPNSALGWRWCWKKGSSLKRGRPRPFSLQAAEVSINWTGLGAVQPPLGAQLLPNSVPIVSTLTGSETPVRVYTARRSHARPGSAPAPPAPARPGPADPPEHSGEGAVPHPGLSENPKAAASAWGRNWTVPLRQPASSHPPTCPPPGSRPRTLHTWAADKTGNRPESVP